MRRTIERVLQLLGIAALLAVALPALKTKAAPTAITKGDFQNGEIVISADIAMYGPGASEALAKQWETWINEAWNSAAEEFGSASCYPVRFDVNMEYLDEEQRERALKVSVPDALTSGAIPTGTNAWYIVGRIPGRFHRALVSYFLDGVYNIDSWGVMAPHESQSTVVHEAGHVFGHDDRYTDRHGADEGWEGNAMASSDGVLEAKNFEEVIDAALDQLESDDLPACFDAQITIDMNALEPRMCNLDAISAELRFDVRTFQYFDDLRLTGQGAGLHDEGTLHWTGTSRCDRTDYGGHRTPDPYPVIISGELTEAGYAVELLAEDLTQAYFTDGTVYSEGSVLGYIFEHAAGTDIAGTLESFTVPPDVKTGDTFSFAIATPTETGYWYVGEAILTIISTVADSGYQFGEPGVDPVD